MSAGQAQPAWIKLAGQDYDYKSLQQGITLPLRRTPVPGPGPQGGGRLLRSPGAQFP
ncbi:hypothetical protein SBV1_170005 [Verrucomicrobia bacterium]|nr:hypothetical protein SBV1_170005 [Verrucomicrobiota bacterium]